jgi:hypothetical protein
MSTVQIEELLDAVDSTLDRLKTLYEQYFLGIQKQAPGFIHNDVERKLRDLTQLSIRNTGLRYRLATLQQKFGSYNSYWRRTLRQIENGTYARNLAKIGREAARTGSDIPEEILAAMPKRMREQVLRDRDAALAIAKRRNQVDEAAPAEDELLTLADEPLPEADVPPPPAAPKKTRGGAHVLNEADADIDFNEMFAAFDDDAPKEIGGVRAHRTATRPPMPKMPLPSEAPQTAVPPKSIVAVPQTTALPRVTLTTPPSAPQPASAIPQLVGRQASGPVAAPPGVQPVGSTATTTAIPRPVGHQASGPVASPTATTTAIPPVASPTATTTVIPRPVGHQASGPVAAHPPPAPGRPTPAAGTPPPGGRPTPTAGTPPPGGRPTPGAGTPPAPGTPAARPTPAIPPITQTIPRSAPSQQSRPVPVIPGSAAQTGPVPVESMSGPFPREQPTSAIPRPVGHQPSAPVRATGPIPTPPTPTQTSAIPRPVGQQPSAPVTSAIPRPVGAQPSGPAQRTTQSIPRPPAAPQKPPPGMTEADVNALHAKYVKAKESVGEKVDAGSREKLLKTISQTAPKIMEQYKASGVDFSVVVKDNQVIIKAKPKT